MASRLEPGEAVEVNLFGITRPLIPRPGHRQRSWYVVLTNRRVLTVRLKGFSVRPAGVEWDELRAGVLVDRYAHGMYWGRLHLRRVSDGQVLKLQFVFPYRDAALVIKVALGG